MSFFFSQMQGSQSEHVLKLEVSPGISVDKSKYSSGCAMCNLNSMEDSLQHPKMQPTGPNNADIYILGEAPNAEEDKLGKSFASSKILESYFPFDLYNKTRRWNIIRCHPGNGVNPTNQSISCCRNFIERDIEKVKPKVILGIGVGPLNWILPGETSIQAWRGRRVPTAIGNYVCWFVPCFHPNIISKSVGEEGNEWIAFEKDVEYAISVSLSSERPEIFTGKVSKGIHLYDGSSLKQIEKVQEGLNKLAREPYVALDIETYPLRPYSEDSRILTISIGTGSYIVSYPLEHDGTCSGWRNKAMEITSSFILNSGTKICHNLVFEQEWIAKRMSPFLLRMTQWDDTMAQAFSLNEVTTGKMLSLDKRVFAEMGIKIKSLFNLDYSDMRKHNLNDILLYNGIDAKFTYLLYEKQRKVLEPSLYIECKRQVHTSITLALSQLRGLQVDSEKAKAMYIDLNNGINELVKKVRSFPEVRKFETENGKLFDLDSSMQVGKILSKYFNIETDGSTKTGRFSTSEASLSKIEGDRGFSSCILEYRQLSKLLSTYVGPMNSIGGSSIVHSDGKLHTSYNAMLTRTGRLSSNSPNVQNFPKRKGSYIRECVIPAKGHCFMAVDYGAMEARVIAMASEDETLVKSLWNKYDIHMDWANRLLQFCEARWTDDWWFAFGKPDTKEKFMKLLRQECKNKWVFPLFFGSSYLSCAESLNMSKDVAKRASRLFWSDFSGVKAWQKRLVSFYEDNGYVQNLSRSRRRRAPLSYNQIINTPIQGTASDIVVDAMCRLSERSEIDKDPSFQAVLNVHDDLVFEVPEYRFDSVKDIVVRDMVDTPFEWAKVVPIVVEVSKGKNWGEMNEIGEFSSQFL